MVRGIVCKVNGPWRESLTLSNDVSKDFNAIKFSVREGYAKIKVAAGGICFPDVLVIEGKHMMKRKAPFVACGEVAGTITELNVSDPSSNPHNFKVGDNVFGMAGTGSLATEAVSPLSQLYKAPSSVDLTRLAGFETNYGTTYHALVDIAEVKSGETLLILGASGGVGMSAIDLGKALGCKVIAAASSDEKLKHCKAAGADVCLNYNKASNGGKDLKTLLKEAGLYGSIDVCYDPVGGDLTEQSVRALGFGGRLIVIGFAAGGSTPKNAIPKLPLNLVLLNERKVVGVLWGAWKTSMGAEQNRENMRKMMEMVENGKLNPVVSKVYDFSNFEEALEDMMSRKVVGKVVMKPEGSKAKM